MMNNYNSLHDSSSTSCKRTWREKAVLLLFFVMFSVFGVNAQVTTNGGSGLAGTYGSLASAITALNGATISSPVVITLTGNETAPVGGYNITATGTSTNTITIQGSSSTITAATGLTSGALNDAIFKITGGDWITIQNFTMQENAANTTTTAASNNMTEFGVALFYATTTNGAQNCTIQNNTITLNRTYQNTFGVYSNSTHSATTVTTSATATTTSGGNSGLKVYGNVISNVNMGILVVGPTAIADVNTGIDIGGSSSTTGNTISNFGTTGTFSGYANVSGTVNGILVRNSNGFNVSYNSITSSNGGVTSGTLNGIQIAAASNAPTATFTNNITYNTIALTSGVSGVINGITYPSGSASTTSVLNVNNNNFTAATTTVANSSAVTLISVASTNLTTNINSNTFTNIVSNTTGSFTFMSYSYTMPAGGSQTINGNSIVTAFSKTGAGGTVTGGTSGASSPNGTFHTFTNNNFSNITVTGATGITGVTNSDGSGSSATRTVTGNTFNNWTGGTSAITAINYNYIGGTTSTISNNTVTNITGQSTVTGINIGSSASLATTLNVANNTISNLTSTGTGSTVTGLSCSNASTTININANAINTLSSTGASAVTALSIGGGATTNVYQNKIYNVSGSNASSTVNGILISAGTTVNTYNNIIGDLRASIASGTDVIRGISITSSTATSNQNVYYNTIYLNGTSTGTNFGSSGIYHTYSATATTAALDMRNNIVVNASGANGTGLAVAFRRSAATDLANYATTSNNNLFFGTSGAFNNGTNYAFGAFQTLVTPRETASKSQNPTFASTTGSAGTFLHFANLAVNLAGANGQAIAAYTTDFDGDARNASTPDIGADEWVNGTITAPTVSSFSPTNICVQGGQTITLNGTSLDTVTSVLFNGPTGINLAGTITGTPTATSLTVIAPAGVVDGGIIVTNPAGSFDTTATITFVQAPTPTVGVSSGVTICSGSSTTLTATGASTYVWTPSLGLNGTTGATVIANPTTTTTYTVTGTSAAGCTATASVTVTVNTTPSAITFSKNPTSSCAGGITIITASGGTIGSAGTAILGTGTSAMGTTSYPNPFSGFYGGVKHQMLYTVAELQAQGLAAGSSITQLKFDLAAFAASACTNLTIRMGTTANTALTGFVTGTTTVYGPTTFTPSATGIITFTLTTPYVWNGTSNLIVETVHNAGNGGNGSGTTNKYSTTATNTVYYGATDNVAGGIAGFDALSSWSSSGASANRPNTHFVYNNVVPTTFAWTPSTDLYSNAGATTAYAGENITTVYSKGSSSVTYTATATSNGCSSTNTVTVSPNALPTISTNGITICDGGAGAALLATGGTSYVWSPATGLSATNVASPTANPTTTTTYTVTGTDANGCQNTATATVTVNNHVVITSQPSNSVVLENAPASFSVSATGTGLTYQWEEFDGASWNTLTGETSATYSIASAGASLNTHQYRCIVSGTSPCAPVTSSAAVLTVGNVSITAQPSNQTICSDATATFTVGTTGTVTSYQWQYSTNGGTTWTDVATGGTTDTLVVGSLNATSTGTLYHVVLNGSVTSNSASVTVRDAVVFDTHPLTQAVCNGTNVTFSTLAYGTGVTYQWQVSTNGTTWNNISGATGTSYALNGVTGALNGTQYRVIATGTSPCSPATSNVATLTVTDVTVAATATSICIGASTSLSATFTGAPNYTTATWSSTTGSGAETAISGTSTTVTPTAAGTYVYTFSTNGTCPFAKTVTVTVNALPVISSVTATPATACSDASISLTAASVTNANGSATLGAGASTSTSAGVNPFYGGYGGVKTQFIIKASELTALGFAAGNITSLGLDLTTAGSTLSGFALSVDHTALTALTGNIETVSNTVYSGSFVPAVGINTINFSTPFAWNGTSNIILSFCWSNNNTSNTVSTVKVDAPGFTSSNARYVDSRTASDVCSYTGSTTPSGWNGASTTGTSRPKFVITGNKATNVASSYTWSWNTTPAVTAATGTTSVSNTTGSAITQTFTATATSAAGCTNSMTTSAVTVNSTIPAPTGTDSTQCGTGTPTCSVTGSGRPGNTFRWYTVSTNGTALAGQTASTLSSYPVSANTTFYVSEASADGLCESPRTAVNVTVTAPYAFTLSTGTMTNCSGSASLTPVTIATNGGYTAYSWSNNGTVSGNETTGWYFSPTTTTTYTVTATGGGCSTTASVVVTPVALPVVNVTASPAAVCVGASSTLTATTNIYAAGSKTLGTQGTTSITGGPYRGGSCTANKVQFLIPASELTAAGIGAGNITGLTFVTTGTGGALPNFTISLGSTALTAMTSTFVSTGLTQVYTSSSYTPVSGDNVHTFSTPYNWDGTSNLIVSVCHDYACNSSATMSLANTAYAATSYLLTGSSGSICSTNTGATTANTRPVMKFAAQVLSQGPGSLTYTWNDSAATTGNVLTVSPTTTTSYTAFGLNGTTGCTGSASATVTVYNTPSAPTATNGARCGTGVVTTATVADTNGFTTPTFKWYADNVTTTALQSSTSASYTTSISATTTFYVSVVSPGGCESARTAITLTVNTPATLTVSPEATVCTGGSTTLTASGAVSYTWTPALGLNGTTSASVVATPGVTTTYSVNGVDANGCTTAAATVKVNVAGYPSAITITQGAASLCANSVMSLTATGGIVGGTGNAVVGTGTTLNSTTGYPSPYSNYYGGTKHQMLIKASELTALGLTTGANISSIAFNVSGVGTTFTGSLSAFQISMKNTSTSVMTSSSFESGMTLVYGPVTQAIPTTGLPTSVTHTLSTPFTWDGTSNIIIETSYSNANSGTSTDYVTMTSSDPGYVSTNYYRADSVSASAILTATTPSGSGNARPNMVLAYSTSSPTTMTWSPTTDLYTDAAATTAYTGGPATVVYTKPSGDITYTATAANGACTTSATTTVTPIALPVFTLADATICGGQSATLTATGAGNTYVWSPSTGLSSTTGATVTASPTATTTYTVVGTSVSTNCTNTHTVTVSVNQPVVISGISPTSNSVRPTQSATYTVNATGDSLTYQWQVDNGGGFADITNDSMYSGATTATLSIADITSDMNGYQYQCVVSGTELCSSATSDPAILNVDSTGIDTQPVSVTACGGGAANFTVAASSDDPEQNASIFYNWEYKVGAGEFQSVVDGFDATTGITFSGSETASLSLTGLSAANNGIVVHAIVNGYIFSSDATLTVKAPVAISAHPANQTVCVTGGTATFSVTATGDNLGYQWQFSTNGTTWSNYTGTGATTASIAIVNPALAANGTQYRVVVSGNAACGSLTSNAGTLYINNPTITSQPVAATAVRGNTVTFTVAASAATSYQWQYATALNGTYTDVVDAAPAGITYGDATTATLSVYTSAAAATGGAKYYRCIVTNNGCTVTSTGALLTLVDYCTSNATNTGDEEIFSVTVNGNTTDSAYSGTNGCTTAAPGAGSLLSQYSNFTSLGSLTSVTRLQNVAFSIAEDECDGATYYSNGAAVWVDFNQDGDFDDAGEKVFVENATTISPRTIAGSFAVPLTASLGDTRMRIIVGEGLSGTSLVPCGTYGYGETEDYLITILPAPVCSGTPVAGTVTSDVTSACAGGSGANLTLSGYTTGVTGIAYQWYYSSNGVDFAPVSGATSTTFTTPSLTATAYYYCAVTCTASSQTVNSNTVTISISDPQLTGTTPASRCGTGTVTLQAATNAGAAAYWYTAATGGVPVFIGNSYVTPSINGTTTYYVSAAVASSFTPATGYCASTGSSSSYYISSFSTTGGVANIANTGSGYSTSGYGNFTNLLVSKAAGGAVNFSATVTGGTFGIGIWVDWNNDGDFADAGESMFNTGAYVSSATGTLTVPAGTPTGAYRMRVVANYLATSPAACNASAISGETEDYSFVVPAKCETARTAVVATVTPLPTATISYAGTPFCSTAGIGNVTLNGTNAYTGGTFSSTAGLSIDSVTGAINVAASTPGTYTVTYTTNPIADCGAQTATTTVVINQALTSTFAYDFASYCTNGSTATPTVTGTAGTFTASPAGLSINAATGAITLATSAAGTYTVTNTVVVAGCANSVSTQTVTISTAVAITSQPISVSKLPTENATFTVAATGTGLAYQWEVNDGSGWAAISGETTNSLTLTAVTSEMNGYQYRVVVSGAGACASVTSSAATLTVSTAAIATNPANYTACSAGANTATFAITTTGDATSFQWQMSTNGTTWTAITNGGNYANADTATLSLSGLTLADNGTQFRCVVNGVVYSNPATLTVKAAVAIGTQPVATTGCSAGGASFSVAATGDGLAYQWQVSTNGTTWSNVSGATSSTLLLTGLTASMNGYQYQVIVSGAAPCSALTSTPATLTVNTAVAITTQPAATTVCPAANATFTVAATGTGLGYQWQMSTNGTIWSDVSGANAASLVVSGATLAMTGYQYRVVVSGAAPCGAVTSAAAVMTVSQPAAPVITPATATICPGSVQTLTVNGGSVTKYSNSFDIVPSTFTVSGTSATAVASTYKAEGTGSVRFNTTATSATANYTMNANVDLSGLASSQLTFSHQTLMEGPSTSYDYGYVEYSADGGATWVTFPTTSYVGTAATAVFTGGNARFTTKSYSDWITNFTGTGSLPNDTLWKTETFNIPAAALTSQFRIRFRYTTDSSTNYYGWMIDNVKITAPNTTVWSPTTGLYTNAGATTAYTGTNLQTVYAKPSSTSTYTVTNTNNFGCSNSATVTVNVNAPSTLGSIAQPLITCSGSQTTFTLTGLVPNSTSTLGYTINGVAQTAITGVVADASGNGSFTVALAAANNGKTLAITSITRTDVTPNNCATTISANNTVTIAVQPLVTYYADADGDGFGNLAVTQVTCQGQPAGYVTNSTDCDDADPTKHASYPFYVDADGDGYGTGTAVSLCAVNATTPPTAGYSVNGTDCNDADPTKHASFSFYVDADGDGYGTGSLVSVCAVDASTPPSGYSLNNTDCNDSDNASHANTTTTSNVTACGSYTWSVNGTTYTTSGTYTYVVNSCHTEVLNLTMACSSVVTVKMMIQGYYAGSGAMTPVLANQGVGSSATDVDNVTIELRDSSTYALVASTTAMLQTNGDAVATFPALSGSYYIAVKHRNAVQTWSANPVAVSGTPTTYDFTTAASQAYGNNMVNLGSGVYGFYSGDLTQDDFVDFSDYTVWETDYNSSAMGNYATDLNGDGFVDFSDYTIWEGNYNGSVFSSHP